MRYLLTKEQMIENGYPMPSYLAETFEKPPGWVETKVAAVDGLLSTSPSGEAARIYAMDCEMVCSRVDRLMALKLMTPQCMTEEGKQLARVCLIDYASGIVVYDQLVKPGKPVVDYLTR